MTNVFIFTGGKRCIECDEQIDPKRLRLQPDARKCTKCQQAREDQVLAAMKLMRRLTETVKERASITIRW